MTTVSYLMKLFGWGSTAPAHQQQTTRRSYQPASDPWKGPHSVPSTPVDPPDIPFRQRGPREQILFYERGEPYYEFTNFSPHDVHYNSKRFPTSEHLFQAHKFFDQYPDIAERIRKSGERPSAPFDMAHRYQRYVRPDWRQVNVQKMEETLRLKFTQHKSLTKLLLDTGDAELIEDSPRDYFWGIGADGSGRNELGKALERLRDELFDEMRNSKSHNTNTNRIPTARRSSHKDRLSLQFDTRGGPAQPTSLTSGGIAQTIYNSPLTLANAAARFAAWGAGVPDPDDPTGGAAVAARGRAGGEGPVVPGVNVPVAGRAQAQGGLKRTPTRDRGMCEYCHKKPKYQNHPYCGRTCATQAKMGATMCDFCGKRPKFGTHPYCSRTCANDAAALPKP